MKRSSVLLFFAVLLFCSLIISTDQKAEETKTETHIAPLVPLVISDGTDSSSFSLYKPNSIAIDNDENVYVLDTGNSCIVKYDKNGRYVKHWGHKGQGPGELGVSPLSTIRFDKNNNLAVAERQFNQRITFFDKDGNYISSFKTEKPADSISIDSKNNIFISVSGITNNDNLIIKYDHNGNILGKFSKVFIEGKDPAYHESLLVHDNDDNLYQVFLFIPYIRKYDPKNNLVFQKEINLENHFSERAKKIWSNYDFSSPANKFGDSWMGFCNRAAYSTDSIYLLKHGSIMKISADGKYISEKSYEGTKTQKYGWLWDLAITPNGDTFTVFEGRENVGVGIFQYNSE